MKTAITTGKVTNNDDPAKAGRIKCEIAEIDGKEFPEWIEPVWQSGWIWLPEAGDTVQLVIPEGEDMIEFADEVRWLGRVYDQDNQTNEEHKENYPSRRGFKTAAGHVLIVDDKDLEITLYTPAGYTFLLSEKTKEIDVKTPAGYEAQLSEETQHVDIKTPGDYRLHLDEANSKAIIYHKGTMLIALTDAGIFFGTEGASEPFVLGALWKTMMDTILNALAAHIHPTGVGPSGPPTNASVYTGEAAKTADTISDFIFGQKAQP